MHDMKKDAHRDVLRKLIALAQEAMMDGMGDDEATGDKIKEAMHEDGGEGTLAEETTESPHEEALEDADLEEPEGIQDHIRREMKQGNRSPLKSGRKVAMMISAKPATVSVKASGRGKY